MPISNAVQCGARFKRKACPICGSDLDISRKVCCFEAKIEAKKRSKIKAPPLEPIISLNGAKYEMLPVERRSNAI